jgi:hypothetical protein
MANAILLCQTIKAYVVAGDATTKEYQIAAGQRIIQLRVEYPETWLSLLATHAGVTRSQAYDLIALAEKRATLEGQRAERRGADERRTAHNRKARAHKVHGRTAEIIPWPKTAKEPKPNMSGGAMSNMLTDEDREERAGHFLNMILDALSFSMVKGDLSTLTHFSVLASAARVTAKAWTAVAQELEELAERDSERRA